MKQERKLFSDLDSLNSLATSPPPPFLWKNKSVDPEEGLVCFLKIKWNENWTQSGTSRHDSAADSPTNLFEGLLQPESRCREGSLAIRTQLMNRKWQQIGCCRMQCKPLCASIGGGGCPLWK